MSLKPLPYAFDALEPYIDAKTMEIHHDRHHQGYVNNANKILEKYPQWLAKSSDDILKDLKNVPADVKTGVKNQVGGVSNHNFFWDILSPKSSKLPQGELAKKIDATFGSFQNFKDKFSASASTVFGSGWAWLVSNNGNLEILALPNQDSPLSLGYDRILTLDVWEHAYYLNYQNKRSDYIERFWNIVNWEYAEQCFKK